MYPWGDNRRFNSYANYFKRTFGERVQKVTIDAGFTCPNRDGNISRGGCTYCDNSAFNPSYCSPQKSVKQQIEEGIAFHAHRYRRTSKYLAYFQAYSNTYAPLEKLKQLYEEALDHPQVIGLVIGTRPDCVDEEKLGYLAELSEKYYVILEYGIESCYNKTLARINRGHTFEQAVWALEETAKRDIKTGAHFILGLPGETKEDIINEIDIISALPLDTIKFHQLQIVKGTVMEKEKQLQPTDFITFTPEEYVDFFVEILERLNPSIVLERFAGEVPPRFLSTAPWSLLRNDQLLVLLEKRLEKSNTFQGKLFDKISES